MFKLIKSLIKIYFSNSKNKETEYRKLIFNTFKDMGGIYIKFLQVLVLTNGFMKGFGGPKEYSIFNHNDYEPIDLNKYINFNDFQHVNENPVAAGSFAVIYEAKVNDKKVIIKVLRPSIKNNLEKDLKKLKRIVNIMTKFINNSMFDIKEAFNQFSENSLLEIDYTREVENIKYFLQIYKNHRYIKIPEVFEELCTNDVIVEEFISGPTLADVLCNVNKGESIEQYNLPNSNVWTQIVIAGGEALRTAIVEDFVFGDPHPGNIILLPDNKIAFIDFGLIATKPTSQEAFYYLTKSYYDILQGSTDVMPLLKSTLMCFCPDLINGLNNCKDINFIDSLGNAILKKTDSLYNNEEFQSLTSNGHLFTVFSNFIDKNNSLNISVDMHNFSLIKAMQAFLGTMTAMDDNYGDESYSMIMSAAIKYALDSIKVSKVKKDYDNRSKYSLGDCYEIILNSLSSLASGDEYLFESVCERM